MHYADPVPGYGHSHRLAEVLEDLASFLIGSQRLRIATLVHSNGAELEFSDGNISEGVSSFIEPNGLLISLHRFVEPPQVLKAVALLGQRYRSHPSHPATRCSPLDQLEPLLGVLQQGQGLPRRAARSQNAPQQNAGHGDIVIGLRIGRLARRQRTLV